MRTGFDIGIILSKSAGTDLASVKCYHTFSVNYRPRISRLRKPQKIKDNQIMKKPAILPWSRDNMDRKGVANFLTAYLDNEIRVKVLNINAPWGTGKTFFLENWKNQESVNGRACVYFNAWEADYSGDPFVSLVAAIRDQLDELIGPLKDTENAVKNFTRKASQTLMAATPALTKGLLKKFTGIEVGIISDAIDSGDLGDAAEKAVEKLIESNKQTLETVNDFKQVFHTLLTLASGVCADNGNIKPVYIYIDELDRCRPTFAIELLERIKHLFDVNGCKFVIATDTSQLGHAVKAVYGSGFDSERYLRRFFDREFTLSTVDYTAWIKTNCVDFKVKDFLSLEIFLKVPSSRSMLRLQENHVSPSSQAELIKKVDLNEQQLVILALANTFKPSLRDLDKINCHLEAICINSGEQPFHFFWAAYLVFLKIEAPLLYNRVVVNSEWSGMKDVAEQYPPREFYTGTGNITVHEVFETYVNLYRGGPVMARETARRIVEHALPYASVATIDFANHFERMSLYPKLVDLAHSID